MDNNKLYLSAIDNLQIADNEWIKEFRAISEAFRINPFEISDSGDLYWADKRNIDGVKASIAKN